MILDSGMVRLLSPTGALPRAAIGDGLAEIGRPWYGQLNHEGAGAEYRDTGLRIRILREPRLAVYDMAEIGGVYWVVTRTYHGVDAECGEEITDITLVRGAGAFVPVILYPAKSGFDDEGTARVGPDVPAGLATFADVRNVAAEEYYSAQVAGIALTVRVAVYGQEYAEQPYVQYDGKTYPVRRMEQDGQRVNLYLGVAETWPG